MQKITDIFQQQEQTLSFEIFPPKTKQGYKNLMETLGELAALKPDFISCTYGAGGGNRDKTLDLVEHIQKEHNITGLAHLTCVLNTKDDIHQIVSEIKDRGIANILALRGDPPADNPDWTPGPNNFQHSNELCSFIHKEFGDHFCLGVAGFPEGHVLCLNKDKDAEFLKIKIDSGAHFVITQLFFDNNLYFDFINRLSMLGISVPIIPGILPITNYPSLLNFTEMCGASVPDEVHQIFEPLQKDKEATRKAGIAYAIKQGRELLYGGAPGLHLYCLNKVQPTKDIVNSLFHR